MKKYRFKTEEEFQKEHGKYWKDEVHWNDVAYMDYLLGTEYGNIVNISRTGVVDTIPNKYPRNGFAHWTIYECMLTEIKDNVPSYEPRKLVRE